MSTDREIAEAAYAEPDVPGRLEDFHAHFWSYRVLAYIDVVEAARAVENGGGLGYVQDAIDRLDALDRSTEEKP